MRVGSGAMARTQKSGLGLKYGDGYLLRISDRLKL